MRQRLGIILTIVLAVGALLAINSLAYVSEEKRQDSELNPNRSSYNAGPTGTRALYDFLSESGHKVMRWREAPDQLLGPSGGKVQTFVIVGRPLVPVDEEEATSLLLWVARGGRLVIVDRAPENHLLPPSGKWKVVTEFLEFPGFGIDPAKPDQMTEGVKPAQPVQPTLFTREVASVMPSKFFSSIKFFAAKDKAKKDGHQGSDQANSDRKPAEGNEAGDDEAPGGLDEPSPNDSGSDSKSAPANTTSTSSPAPVVHLTTTGTVVLVDYPHGKGRIALLSDPFIIANDGIALSDNLQLAINLLAAADGVIAFDEFHQGRALTRNAFASYFAGTPVLAICGQIVLVIMLILWTRGRRFGRPLPLPQIDRRSSLEFVASMAELQQRAHAFDLAIENIYSRTRRVLARYAGVDYNTPRAEIAARVAARSTLQAHQVETLMRQSEEAINGGGISGRQTIDLVKRLREVESALGLRLRSREVKQTAQNI